ncbi:hypothetical protein LCGC14_1182840 [marine sediment metagenome]|uniref:histidine kinase n=1 Tax=marine sediment metagenome TaxID=412755 RepID=A0A0F9PS46_9ZZZZ|nr:hypothetical protein [Actinomycetota bacterium]
MEPLVDSILSKSLFYNVSHLVIVVFALILGLLAYKRSPHNPNNKSFLALNLSLAIWAIITHLSNLTKLPIETQIIINRLTFTGAFALVIAFFHFCMVFPEKKINKPYIFRMVLISSVLLAVYAGVADWLLVEKVTEETVTFIPINLMIFQMFFMAYALFSFWALAILYSKVRKLTGKKHTQVQYIFLAFLIFIIYVFSTNLIPGFFGLRFFIGHTALGSLLFIGLAYYAVIKHRLMDIRLIVIKSAAYTILAVLGISFYILMVFYFKNYYEKIINPDIVFFAASFAVVFGFKPLGRLIQRQADKIFSKGRYDFNDLLKQLSRIISSQIILDNLAKSLLSILSEQMKISKSTFVGKDNYQYSEGINLSQKAISKISKMVKPNEALVADELEDDSAKKRLMTDLGIEVLVFFCDSEEQTVGFLALSKKSSGDSYALQDLRLLEIIAPQITVALKNIEQQTKIIEQIVEERRRIDQDAHDHIYNRLGALAKKAEVAELYPEEARATCGLIKNDLRSAVSDLQKIVHDRSDDEKGNLYPIEELKKICEDFEAHSSIRMNFKCSYPDLAIADPKHLWHLQCILEECLNNVRKHSKATGVAVGIKKNKDSIVLEVKDDGVGIDTEKQKQKTKNGHQGLKGMRERAKKINAKLTISSNNGKGTAIVVKAPI